MQQIEDLLIDVNQSIRDALVTIDLNGCGVCFVTDDDVLIGVATDGDIRRSLLKDRTLECSIGEVMNRSFASLPVNSDESLIRQSFSPRLRLLPLCDEHGRVVDVADALRSHRIPVLEPELSGKELEYVQDCIDSNWISSQGRYVARFEEMFEEMHPGMHAVAVSNGTVALHLALASLGVSEGDEVIVPDLTFAATVNAVLYCNAVPVLCEIDSDTWCIDPEEVERLITPETKAIIPVHLYGQVCQMDLLRNLAEKHDLLLVEDCAEALGSKWNNVPVGTFGDAATFSFFGNKMISTGEGGMVLYGDRDMARKARVLRDHGMSLEKRYWHECVGYNYRMTNVQAAIGVAQMERFQNFVEKKQDIASCYKQHLSDVDGVEKMPVEVASVFHSQWLYTVLLADGVDRDGVVDRLMQYGIESRPVFYSMHLMPPYQNIKRSDSLAHSLKISVQGVSLPSSVRLSIQDIKYVSDVLKDILDEECNG